MHLEPPPGPAPGTSAGPRSLAPREVVARRPAAAPAGSTGAASSPAPAFVALLPGAFRYAWQGDAWILLFGAAGLSLLLDLVPGPFGVLGWILGFWVAAYFFSLFREVFHSTIHGEDRLPSSPDVSYAWEDVRELLVRWLVPQLVAFAPLMVAEWIPGTPVGVKVVLAAFGCFYAPMALLGVLVSDSLVAVSPWFVGRSILRAPLDYTVLAVLLGLPFLVERIPGLLPGGTVGGRAIGLAVSAVMTLVLVYLALVWVRLLGLFYRCHRERLGWVLETRDTEIPL